MELKYKVGDRVKFKQYGIINTGTILAIVSSDTLLYKISPDHVPGVWNYRKKVALSEKALTLI